jgi:hypothetical protein
VVVKKSSIFWGITPCGPLKVERCFRRICRSACYPLLRLFLAQLILRPWRCGQYVLLKFSLTFFGLHGVISQKILLFITTAVRISNPTSVYTSYHFLITTVLEKYVINFSGCADGSFGINCKEVCGYCSKKVFCNKTNGRCANGCESTYSPPMCKKSEYNMHIKFILKSRCTQF